MRFRLSQTTSAHTEIVSVVGWNANNECYSFSDDKSTYKWDGEGELGGKVCDLDSYVTDMHWFPAHNRQAQGADVYVIGCADGKFKICGKNGVVKTSVDAHQGAVISLRWSHEGTALATGGEDGVVKVWSKSGMLRSSLAELDGSIYSVSWSPDSDVVLFSCGKDLLLKPLQPSAKQLRWKAHDGTVLCTDWNPLNNLIVSGGEDRRYKLWDSYGRLLCQSSPAEFVITSVSWAPPGDVFAVGSFNSLWLCDKAGWPYCKEKPMTGSVMSIGWSADGTQLAAGGGNGSVSFGTIVQRRVEWGTVAATLDEPKMVRVADLATESSETLDFRDHVAMMSLNYGHLIVATSTQCYIYRTSNFNTPHIFDVKSVVTLLLQSSKHWLMVDQTNGIQIFSHEGRLICTPKQEGLRTEFLDEQSVNISDDTLVVLDKADQGKSSIRFFETSQGKPIGEPITHVMDIVSIATNHFGSQPDRRVVFIDRNRDLYITPVLSPAVVRLSSMVDTVSWNTDDCDMLCAVADSKLVVWHYPNAVYVDRDLVSYTKHAQDGQEYGRLPKIVNFSSTRCTVRRTDGALSTVMVSPHPSLLQKQVAQGMKWDRAVRLCRFANDEKLWGCLALLAIQHRELNTAETAFAALGFQDKVAYMLYVKDIPTEEGRAAEFALMRRRSDEAENILLQAQLVYRAIKMNIRLFNFDRALELAVQYKTHVDTVLWYRQRFLSNFRRKETNEAFLSYASQVELNEDAIKAKIKSEKEKEASRPGAKRYVGL